MAAYYKTNAPLNWTATADSILEKLQSLCAQFYGTVHCRGSDKGTRPSEPLSLKDPVVRIESQRFGPLTMPSPQASTKIVMEMGRSNTPSREIPPNQAKAWIFDSDLILFGDSLFDNGNYVRQANPGDLVLGEAIGDYLGVYPQSVLSSFNLGDIEPLDVDFDLSDLGRLAPNAFKESLNYAVSGATTGLLGSFASNLGDDDIGLMSQVEKYLADVSPAALKNPRFAHDDAIISAGNNDVFEYFFSILQGSTELPEDVIDRITGNITNAVDRLDDYLDDIVILGLAPLGQTLLFQQLDFLYPGISNSANFLSRGINNTLSAIYDNPSDDRPDVFVVDGFKAFNNAQSSYFCDSGSLNGFFRDLVHPSSAAISFLSAEISGQILTAIPDFTIS